jgi:hypothetical protein
MKATILFFLIALSLPASAGWIDKQGNEIADSDNMKSANSFIAQQIITDDEKQAFKNWGTPSQSVYFPTSDKIERNKIITALIVFGGCAADANGNCDLKMQITVYQPDGAIYSKLPVMEVWSGKPAPPDKSLGLSVGYLRVIIEDGEQLGKYKVATKVTDEISGDSMLLTSYFTVIEAK